MADYPLASSENSLNKSVKRYTEKVFPVYRFVPGLHPHPVNSPEGHSYGLDEEEVSKWNSDDWRLNEDPSKIAQKVSSHLVGGSGGLVPHTNNIAYKFY